MNRLRVGPCEEVGFIVRMHVYVRDLQRSEDEFPFARSHQRDYEGDLNCGL